MKTGWKTMLALGFVGAVAVAGVAFGQIGDDTPSAPSPDHPRLEKREGERRPHRMHRRLHRRLVHGEFKVATDDGFATIKVDVGEVTAVDHGDKTLSIKRRDGEVLTFTATDDTNVRKDGHRTAFDAIKVGDHARVVQIDRGDGFVLRRIGVHSPEADAASPTALSPAADEGLLGA